MYMHTHTHMYMDVHLCNMQVFLIKFNQILLAQTDKRVWSFSLS